MKRREPKDLSSIFVPIAVARKSLLPALVLTLCLGGVGQLSAGPQFAVIDLGPGEAIFISADGQILGDSTQGGTNYLWLWQNGVRTFINSDFGPRHEVNRAGDVVGSELGGYYMDGYGDFVPYSRAYLWSQGNLTRLGTLGGLASSAKSMNNSNVIVGVSDDALQIQQPFVWQNGVMSALTFRSPSNSSWDSVSPMRIIDDGRIFGVGTLTGAVHAIQLAPSKVGIYDLSDLGALPGIGLSGSLNAFNQFGLACGEGEFSPPLRVEAFLLKGGTATLLGNLGSDGSYGLGLNDFGDVVGESNSSSYRAFLWRDSVIYDLNSCIDTNSGWLLASAKAINNAGQIVGHGMVGGSHHAFLLQPVSGSDGGLWLTLRPASGSQWLLTLTRQLGTHVGFEVSADLVQWTPISYQTNNDGYLVDTGPVADPRFFRALVKP
jgi:probable HAF family extracellular repeat protein